MVFAEAARTAAAAAAVLSSVAASLGVSAGDLQDSLFADLPGERLVTAPPGPLSPAELAEIERMRSGNSDR
jgi:predicted nuclease of restriction endonuclease-like RecB superfamily